MRRKSRQKFTWMPTLGSRLNQDGEPGYAPNVIRFQATPELSQAIPPDLTGALVNQAIIPDFPVDVTDDTAGQYTLRDITEGQDWILKRMVGKFHAVVQGPAYEDGVNWPFVYVTLGFYVARAIDGEPNDVDLTAAEFDPQGVDNIRQPWIWRRTWLLGNPFYVRQADVPITGFSIPCSTMEMGSVADGPHIDSKIARRVLREQRLWVTMSVMGWHPTLGNVTGSKFFQPIVYAHLDLRILGAMRKSRNRPAF